MSKKYVSLIGVGGMYVWTCAALYWIPETKSFDFGTRAFGYMAVALVSASMPAFFLYTNSKEVECERLREQMEAYRAIVEGRR